MSVIVRVGALENDGIDYDMWFETAFSQPGRSVSTAERFGSWPEVTAVVPGGIAETLYVNIRPRQAPDEALDGPLRSALLRTLDTDRSAVPIIVAESDGSRERYRYYVAQAPTPQENDVDGLHWVFTLVSAGDTKWRALQPTTVVWEVFDSGEQQAIQNNGDAPALPRYQVVTTADRLEGWDWRFFVALDPNTSYSTLPDETPYDVTGGGWNTAALVTAGTLSSADEIGAIVDGQEVRRWVENFNTTATRIWISAPFRQMRETRLRYAIGAADVVSELEVHPLAGDLRAFPASGLLRIDNEIFTYAGKDVTGRKFVDVKRAAKDSTGGAHSSLAVVRWIEHEIWVVYGSQARAEEFPDGLLYDDRRPTLDFATSTNYIWRWVDFPSEQAGEHRYPKWRPFRSKLGRAGQSLLVSPGIYNRINLGREPGAIDPATGQPVAGISEDWRSHWWVKLPGYTVVQLYATTYSTRYDNGDWLALISDTNEQADALMPLARPPTLNTLLDEYPAWSGGREMRQLYFSQYGTAHMLAELTALMITFDNGAGLGPRILRTTPRDNYSMDLTLRNLTREEAITLRVDLALGDGLVVDSYSHTVTQISDGTGQYHAIGRDRPRADLLVLDPGQNILQVDEEGLQGVEITITFEERSYS